MNSNRSLLPIFIFFFVSVSSLNAQKENNIWYFGNGVGLDFSNGSANVISNSSLYTNEGCASVCDKTGKLLFYTDGTTVWDRTHQQIHNGSGLGGSYSSTQSALIVPKPNHPESFYIFTIDEKAGNKGLSYSMVDMSLNNKKGGITKKNVQLLRSSTEKLTAIGHGKGKGVWVLAHEWNSNAFYAYLVTAEGVGEAVISKTGIIHKDYGSGKNNEAIGYMKSSTDGRLIACATERVPSGNIELFDFDTETGKISLRNSITAQNQFAYGISFSPDNSKLYVSFEDGGGIFQYDLKAANIAASAITISTGNGRRYGAMQIAPDGKIYIATSLPELDVIQNPNNIGSNCNYQQGAINLGGKYSTFGLPNFIETSLNFYGPAEKAIPTPVVKKNMPCTQPFKIDLGKDTTLCGYDIVVDAGQPGANYLWNTGATTQTLTAKLSGAYWVTVSKNNCTATDTIKITYSGKPSSFACTKEFNPDNGSFNSRFDYMINDIDQFELKIMNKNGKVVFNTTDVSKKWDGKVGDKNAPLGTYTWEVKYRPTCPPQILTTKTGVVNILKK